MRILLLAHAPSVHTQRWARAFAGRGHEVRLLSVTAAPGAETPGETIGWSGAPVPALRYLTARDEVRNVLASWRPAVTVAHFLPNYGFLAALAGASPFVLVAWGSDLLVNARRTPLHAARARWVLGQAALVHVDAANLAAAARDLGAPDGRVWTRAWGVESAAFAPAAPWRERADRAGMLRVLWVRMLEPIYDPATFVRALGRLRHDGVPFQATMAGEGPLRANLEEMAARLGLADSLRFVGRVDEARLRALYRDHEVYVSMSRSDSTSQSLLEAMAAGLLPVVSDIPGNEPWVRDAGIVVPCGDDATLAARLAGALRDPDAPALVARGLSRVRAEADWFDTVRQCESKLLALAGGGGA